MNKSEFDKLFPNGLVIHLSDEDKQKIDSLPCAQKRATIYKKFVRVEREYVIKGPYDYKDKCLRRVLQANEGLKALDRFFEIETFQPIHSILFYDSKKKEDDNYFLNNQQIFIKWKLIGEYDDLQLFDEITKVDQETLKYVKRNSISRRVTDVEKDPICFTDEIAEKVVYHLYFRYLLDLGDSGPHNILFHNSNIYGIDFDEGKRGSNNNVRTNKFSLLFGSHSTIWRERLYSPAIAKFKFFTALPEQLSHELKEAGYDVRDVESRILLFKYLLY